MLCSGQPANMVICENVCVSCWSKVQKTTFINSILTLGHYKHFENACLCCTEGILMSHPAPFT